MSLPAGGNKSLLNILLFGMMIFLGLQLVCNSRPPAPLINTAPEILTKMRELSVENKPDQAKQLLSSYNTKLQEDLKAGKLKQPELDRLSLQAHLTVADAYRRKALATNDIKVAELGFVEISNWERKYKNNPIWKQKIDLPGTKATEVVPTTGAAVYQQLTEDLDKRYRGDKVWGLFSGYYLIDSLVNLTGKNPAYSYAIAALILALIVRAIIWPLAQKQLMWGRQMSQLQPTIKELEEAFKKKDPTGAYRNTPEFQQKMMGLYKEYGVNPMAGCAPALLQMPLFLFVYACMVHYRFEFRNGTFLWINPGTSASTNGFLAPSLGDVDYILLVLYGVSMIVSTLLAPVSDPNQAKLSRRLGIGIAVFMTIAMALFFPVPSAFVLYWIFTNIFSSLQSLRAYRLPMPELKKVNAPGGGVFPVDPIKQTGKNGKAHTNGKTNGKAATDGLFKNPKKPTAQKPKED